MKTRTLLVLGIVGATASMSCGPSDFDPETLINTVRIMAAGADKPYAEPGDTVNLQVLAYDGRPQKPRPMKQYWLPLTCVNPVGDAYYGCFSTIAALTNGAAGAGDAGTVVAPDGGALDATSLAALGPCLISANKDLSPCLPTGPNFQITLPKDIVATHRVVQGASAPYGLAIVFNIACAGHVQIAGDFDPKQPQSIPLGCFDDAGNRLGAEDYVFGYTRAYAYEADSGVTNQNPVINDVKIGGQIIDPHVGFTVQHGAGKVDVDVDVPPSSQEETPDKDQDGKALGENVFAVYFITLGKIDDEVRILYEPTHRPIGDHKTQYEPPADPGEGFMWIVVHDNRGGVTWVQVPIHAQ